MKKIAVIVAQFNPEITEKMEWAAIRRIRGNGMRAPEVIRVPGSFELPLAAERLLKRKAVDAVVVLGALVKGGSAHDELIANAIAPAILGLQLKYGKPIGFGVLGPKISWQQAKLRAEGYAFRAADAAMRMLETEKSQMMKLK